MKVAINSTPLSTGHAGRGIGFYTKHLLAELKKLDVEIQEFSTLNEINLADLIHFPFFDISRRSLQWKYTLPTIVTIHDLIPVKFYEHYPLGVKSGLNWQWQKRAIKNIDQIITDSECSKKDIIELLKIPEDKIKVVSLAAASGFRVINDQKILKAIKQKYNLPEKFGLYVGDVNWNKNLTGLANSCLSADLDLVVIGKGFSYQGDLNHPELAELKQFRQIVEGKSNVHQLGFVETEDLVAIMNLATIYLQLSRYEGFGLPILEAQACGVPVIASNRSSLPEVAGDSAKLGRCGLY
jgi:glycosyltransferase involved in cell wall biosynthesis